MRKWTAAADVRRGAVLPPVRYSDDSTALSAALPTVPVVAPSTTAKARMVRWPRLLGLTLGVWSVSYLARQALTWGSADMPFSPLGSFALEGIALADCLHWRRPRLEPGGVGCPPRHRARHIGRPRSRRGDRSVHGCRPIPGKRSHQQPRVQPDTAAGANPHSSSGMVARAARRPPAAITGPPLK